VECLKRWNWSCHRDRTVSSCYGESIAGCALKPIFASQMAVVSVTGARHSAKEDCRKIGFRGQFTSVLVCFTTPGFKNIIHLRSNLYIQLQDKGFASMRRNRENRASTAQRAELAREQLNKRIPATARIRMPSHRQSER
jgi:hypothetical protein